MSFRKKLGYARKVLPGMVWQGLHPVPRGPVHLILGLADHFEPGIDPTDGQKRAPRVEQEQRVESWCREYPRMAERYRDHEGRPFVHTYFYPAEQYDEGLIELLAELCHNGWGELEVHLHHGFSRPDTCRKYAPPADGIQGSVGIPTPLPRRGRRIGSASLRFRSRRLRPGQLCRWAFLRRGFRNEDSCRDRLLRRLHISGGGSSSSADCKNQFVVRVHAAPRSTRPAAERQGPPGRSQAAHISAHGRGAANI